MQPKRIVPDVVPEQGQKVVMEWGVPTERVDGACVGGYWPSGHRKDAIHRQIDQNDGAAVGRETRPLR